MPSVFNHENNSCWGIRKPTCELFLSENKLNNTHVDNKLAVNSENKTNSTPHYHVSSNAYYGYQRHVNTERHNFECAMDTIENTTPNVDSDIQMTEFNGAFDLQYNGINLIKRKRNYQEVSAIAIKRMRQEEPLNGLLTPPAVQSFARVDYPRCQMEYTTKYEDDCGSFNMGRKRRIAKKEEDGENNRLLSLENLLKQTHGCDLYNFNQSSFDI